jgi:hypothetical protein
MENEYPLCPQSAMGIGGRDSRCPGHLMPGHYRGPLPPSDRAIKPEEHHLMIWECTVCEYKTIGVWSGRLEFYNRAVITF